MGRNDSGLLELKRLWDECTNAKKVYDNARYAGYKEVDKRHEDLEHQTNEKFMVYRAAKKKLRETGE